jgi:hypothetical protein
LHSLVLERTESNLSKINWLYGVILLDPIVLVPWSRFPLCHTPIILILFVRESIFVRWGSPFPIVLVPRYMLSLCHTPIKPDLLGFPGIGVFACGLRDHMITRFASFGIKAWLR